MLTGRIKLAATVPGEKTKKKCGGKCKCKEDGGKCSSDEEEEADDEVNNNDDYDVGPASLSCMVNF